MQFNPNLLKAGAAVIVFGLLLLGFTYAVEFHLPLIGLGIIVYLGCVIYRAAKQQGMF